MIAQPRYYIEITRDVLDLKKLYDLCVTEDTGGIDVFIGTVRDHFDGKQVTSIDYQGYPEMAEKFLQKIVERTFTRWKVNRIAIQHRLGLLQLREASVIIVVAAPHREEAFTACRFIIEEVKKDLPIWKKEFFESGEVAWKAEPFHAQK